MLLLGRLLSSFFACGVANNSFHFITIYDTIPRNEVYYIIYFLKRAEIPSKAFVHLVDSVWPLHQHHPYSTVVYSGSHAISSCGTVNHSFITKF